MSSTDISGLGNTFMQGQVSGKASGLQKQNQSNGFSSMMGQLTAQAGNRLHTQSLTNMGNKSGNADKMLGVNQSYDRYQSRENGIKKQTLETGNDKQQIDEKLDAYAEDVKEVLKENLGLTDEEIEEAMAVLGLSAADLLNSGQLANLVAELTGCEDVSALLCNCDFMQIMQEVSDLGAALEQELGISLEELAEMCEASQKQPDQTLENMLLEQETAEDGLTEGKTGIETTVQTTELSEEPEHALTEQLAVEQNPENAQKANLQTNEDSNGNDAEQPQEQDMQEKGKAENTGQKETTGLGEHKSADQGMANAANHTAPLIQNQSEAVSLQGTQNVSGYSNQLDTTNIIRQIVEAARVTVADAGTTLEMQLNPEHLGKIYLEVTAREGSISARIVAQNEAVKAALEVQAVELKQSMEQAGVKVDAVEVTVGSHEFEKNLEQNAKQEERQAEERDKSEKQTRKINLNDLNELNGIMTEEETLVAQMMADQGNSVDFTA